MHIFSDLSLQTHQKSLCLTSFFVRFFSPLLSEIRHCHASPLSAIVTKGVPMTKKVPETTDEKKYFVLFETDEEGIRQFQSCSDQNRSGAMLSKMCIEGKMVPALKLEVNKNAYDIFKREQWMQEHHYRIENRAHHQRSKRKKQDSAPSESLTLYTLRTMDSQKTLSNSRTSCPYNNKFNLLKGKTCFSTLSVTDKDGNTDSYEPVSTRDINYTDHYQELLTGWISYIQKNYPQYNRYVELINLLGNEFTLKRSICNSGQTSAYPLRLDSDSPTNFQRIYADRRLYLNATMHIHPIICLRWMCIRYIIQILDFAFLIQK